jgi:hypothetical protein
LQGFIKDTTRPSPGLGEGSFFIGFEAYFTERQAQKPRRRHMNKNKSMNHRARAQSTFPCTYEKAQSMSFGLFSDEKPARKEGNDGGSNL